MVYPGTMTVMRKEKKEKLLRYADKVWNITKGKGGSKDDDAIIDAVIEKTDEFFRSVGQKTKLSEYGIGQDTIDTIVNKFKSANKKFGENGMVTPSKVREILESRL